MLATTRAIVLRSVKYGDTSLITQLFTEAYGVQTYIVKGVRKSKSNQASLLQPSTLLHLEIDNHPQKNIQYLKQFQSAHLFQSARESIVKNSVLLFATELLLRLLPEHAPLPELFDFSFDFFVNTDQRSEAAIANYPLFFIINIGNLMGYEIKGAYGSQTPYINMEEGSFTDQPAPADTLDAVEVSFLSQLLLSEEATISNLKIPASKRGKLLHWYIDFLRLHSQHMGAMKSLEVLRAILH